MKKIILTVLLLFFTPAFADVCYDVNEIVAKKAIEILKKQQEIYEYCSICQDAEPQKITIQTITQGNPLLVNGSSIDLAHTYYKENNQFINLGIASGCIKAGQYNIKNALPELPITRRNKETNKQEAKKEADKIYETCATELKNKTDRLTTADMVKENILVNDCLDKAIREEIKKAFEPEKQEEMFAYFKQTRANLLKFYANTYSANKYCDGRCGSMSVLLPYVDENSLLMQMLESLIFLNLERNGY